MQRSHKLKRALVTLAWLHILGLQGACGATSLDPDVLEVKFADLIRDPTAFDQKIVVVEAFGFISPASDVLFLLVEGQSNLDAPWVSILTPDGIRALPCAGRNLRVRGRLYVDQITKLIYFNWANRIEVLDYPADGAEIPLIEQDGRYYCFLDEGMPDNL